MNIGNSLIKNLTISAVFRLSMDLEELYNHDLSNRKSEEFQRLSQKLTEAIDKEYEALPGTQRSRLIGIK